MKLDIDLETLTKVMQDVANMAQPMDTAPRDGTRVLVWDGEAWVAAFWDDTINGWCVTYNRRGYVKAEHPLCWLPLPGKPEGV